MPIWDRLVFSNIQMDQVDFRWKHFQGIFLSFIFLWVKIVKFDIYSMNCWNNHHGNWENSWKKCWNFLDSLASRFLDQELLDFLGICLSAFFELSISFRIATNKGIIRIWFFRTIIFRNILLNYSSITFIDQSQW